MSVLTRESAPSVSQEETKVAFQKSFEGWEPISSSFWRRFNELGLPDSKHPNYQSLRLKKSYETLWSRAPVEEIDPAPYIYPECRERYLVFVNGYFCPHLSQLKNLGRLLVLPMEEARQGPFSSFLETRKHEILESEKDPFVHLSHSFSDAGAFIYLPPKLEMSEPVQILNLVTVKGQNQLTFPHLSVFMSAQSSLKIYQRHVVLAEGLMWTFDNIDLTLEKAAQLKWVQEIDIETDPLHYQHFSFQRSSLKKDAQLESTQLTEGSFASRFDYHSKLEGEGAEATFSGAALLNKQNTAHFNVLAEHVEPNTASNQIFKNVLNDSARASFKGKIYVHDKAQQTNAYQINNNLLLSDRCLSDSKPELEIMADDVKASHGSTVGHLDEQQLFYLLSRGVEKQEATSLLLAGFLQEVSASIGLKSIKAKWQQRLSHYFAASKEEI